jgi:hypothetical protein
MPRFAQRPVSEGGRVDVTEVIGAFALAFVASLLAMDYMGVLHIPLIGY